MKAINSMVGWNPPNSSLWSHLGEPGKIEVGLRPDGSNDYDNPHWSMFYFCTGGFCEPDRWGLSMEAQIAMLFIDFNRLVVGDGIDPLKVHKEFLKIDEYRKMIPPNWPHADQDGGFVACREGRPYKPSRETWEPWAASVRRAVEELIDKGKKA